MPKILFVAMSNSIHTARWLKEFEGTGWEIHLFPSMVRIVHQDISKNVILHGMRSGFKEWVYSKFHMDDRVHELLAVIKKVKPDIVHSLEMQHAGYLVMKTKDIMGDKFPTWVHTPWGSDIYLFGRLIDHKVRIMQLLSSCDYYLPKSERDIQLAKEFGFKGEFLPIIPGNGGLDINNMRLQWVDDKCSDRKIIMVKGYQGIMGRSLVALRALEMCSDILKDYMIIIYSAATEDVIFKSELMHASGIQIVSAPYMNHWQMMKWYGSARLSIGLNISDGVPNSLLESMAMGAFPIESNTSCANEWIEDGKTGFIVPPEDPEVVAQKIRIALTDDNLVDNASEVNYQIALQRIDKSVIHNNIIQLYMYIDVIRRKRLNEWER
jgi:hypothetical protein